MSDDDWAKQQCDSFSEYNLLIDIFASLFTLLLHIFFLEKMNLDTVVTEFAALCFGSQQFYHVLEKKKEADDQYIMKDHIEFGIYELVALFWIFMIGLVGFYF